MSTDDSPDGAEAVDGAKADRRIIDSQPAPDVTYAPVKCADNLLFCEDFEAPGPGLDPARWEIKNAIYYLSAPKGLQINLDQNHEKRGTQSMLFRQTKQTAERDGFIKPVMSFPLGKGNLFVRYFVYMENPTPDRWWPTFMVTDATISAPKNSDERNLWSLGIVPSSVDLGKSASFFEFDDRHEGVATKPVPLGRWACWEFEFRGAEKRMLFYVDGKATTTEGSVSLKSPAKVRLMIGYLNGHEDIVKHPGDGFFDFWVDDIAVSDQRIGCPQ